MTSSPAASSSLSLARIGIVTISDRASAGQYADESGPAIKAYLDEMSKRLSLSQPQKEKLNEILDDTRAKYREVRERHKPEMKAIQDEQVEKVNAMLSEAQRAEYAKMRAEREAKRLADEKGRRPKPTSSSK